MINIVTNKIQIQSLHRQFHKKLNQYFTEKIFCRVGYPGGSFEDNVYYSSDLNLWIGTINLDNRFWNGFGHGRPIDWNSNSISGEINFSINGLNRRIAGAFGQDDNGNIFVLHRGRIGGGKPGIGKNYFKEKYRGEVITAIDDDRETEFCLVGELNSSHFPQQVATFINEIHRVKNLENQNITKDFNELIDFNYIDEHTGTIVTERNEPLVIERTHGLVVNALARLLESRGLQIGNDRNRDLFIHNGKQIQTLFEIKTSSSTQCLYASIGQLLLYSIPIPNPVKLIAVLPEKLNQAVKKRFSSLDIDILYFEWNNDKINFIDIENIL